MIVKHKIIVENNEKVLVVYLDNNLEEFASELGDNAEESEKNLKEQIQDYIKKHNIKFSGKVVKVLAGALLVATLAFAPGGDYRASAASLTQANNQSYVVEPGDSLWRIANNYGISVDDLKEMNDLTTDTIQPGQTLIVNKTTALSSVYIVSENDSLYKIAQVSGLSISDLKSYNHLTSDTIHPGQKLLLIPDAEVGTYTVKSGDSLWHIAKNYSMSVEDLKRLNDISETIFPGQELKVIQAASPDTYTVQPGDSLWGLARGFNTTVDELKSINNLSGDTIYLGQTLYIPNVSETPPITEIPSETKMTVTIKRYNGTIQYISLEEYVTGVVAAELGAGFNDASYKAQALAARTYAAKRVVEGKIITDTDSHQVYKDESQIRQLWGENDYNTYYPQVEKAVNDTRGEVIKYNGDFIDALFFSTSNGKTENPVYVWGGELDYLQSVDSHWDTKSPYFYRVNTFTTSEFAARLGVSSSNLYANVLFRTANGSVNTINISGRSFSGNYVKSRLGLRSTDFDIRISGGKVTIEQRGWGHSVGMSQYGAYFMGEEGYTYDQIIHHYYQGVDINRI
ncbi:stage II sporulation protein D [Mycoplasmatota bacterium]|nr:stage II sporulation protein D [Mycoplasmatota bacterium]